MTWVIGASSALGNGLMASDVRISFGDSTEVDLLSKSYPVGPYIFAGFAGSVEIGLRLIGNLQRPGISPHIFVDAIGLGSFWSGTYDKTTYRPDGRKSELRMPEVASNYSDFVSLCQKIGKAATRAVA